jgi:hypothetical protein
METTMNDTRQTADNITPPRQLTNSTAHDKGNYIPTWTDTRPGSQDHEAVPTLHCGARYYRDGRVEAA